MNLQSTCAVDMDLSRFITQELTVIGRKPFAMSPFLKMDVSFSDNVSSFVVDRINGLYAVFLGTVSGNVLKVKL